MAPGCLPSVSFLPLGASGRSWVQRGGALVIDNVGGREPGDHFFTTQNKTFGTPFGIDFPIFQKV